MSEIEKESTENEEAVVEDNENVSSNTNSELVTEEAQKDVLAETEVVPESQPEKTYVEKSIQGVKEMIGTIDVKNIKQQSVDFIQYFVRSIKRPDAHLSTPVIWYHVIMGLLFVFSGVLFAVVLERDTVYSLFGTWPSMTDNFWVNIISKKVHLSLILLIMVAVTTIIQKNFLSRDVTFRSVFVEFTSRLSLPTVVLFVAGILTYSSLLPRTTQYLILYLMLTAILLLPILSVTTSKKRNEEVEMPIFYATLLTLFLIFATLYIVYELVI